MVEEMPWRLFVERDIVCFYRDVNAFKVVSFKSYCNTPGKAVNIGGGLLEHYIYYIKIDCC